MDKANRNRPIVELSNSMVHGTALDLGLQKWQVLLKKYTNCKKWMKELKPNNPNRKKFYIRAICAIYNTEILLKENLTFSMKVKNGMTCAQEMYIQMLKRGFNTNIISDFKMSEYIYHLAHATMVLNPEFRVKNKTDRNYKKNGEDSQYKRSTKYNEK